MYRKVDDFVDFPYLSNLAIFLMSVSVFVPVVKKFTFFYLTAETAEDTEEEGKRREESGNS